MAKFPLALKALVVGLSAWVVVVATQQCTNEDFNILQDGQSAFSVSRTNGTCTCRGGFVSQGTTSSLGSLRVDSLSVSGTAVLNSTVSVAGALVASGGLGGGPTSTTVVNGNLAISGTSLTFADSTVQTTAFNLNNLLALLCSSAHPFVSCVAVQLSNCQSGVYTIDVDGAGPEPAFQAYCDMSTRGGGWTLAMKIDGGVPTFQYHTAYWTANNVLNPAAAGYDTTEAKLHSFNVLPAREVMLGFRTCRTAACPVSSWNVVLSLPSSSPTTLLALISPGNFVATGLTRTGWMNMVPGSSLEPNCNREGFNSMCGGTTDPWGRVRIGITANNENDCVTCDTWIGVGGQFAPCGGGDPNMSAGNLGTCPGYPVSDVAGTSVTTPNNLARFAYVFVR